MMKDLRSVAFCALVIALFPLGGCLEIGVKTKIADDGSSERVISVKRPAKTLPEHAYPLTTGPGWTPEWTETGDKDLPYEYSASKRFPTPEDLSIEYSQRPDTGAVTISVSVERSFEWFSTYIDYRETYSLTNPFEMLPARDHFSPGEIARIALGEKSDSLNKRIEEWDYRNTFEEFYSRLIRAVGDGDADVNRARLEGAKEEMLRRSREDTAGTAGDEAGHTLRLLEKALGTKAIRRYEGTVAGVIAVVDSMYERRKSADRWISSVVMPGGLVSANGETLGGGEVRWQIDSKQLLVTSVFMEARSRVTNIRALAAAGALALLVLVPVVLGFRRRGTRR